MYSDYRRRAPVGRANDEFLRRMIGGELTSADMPVMNADTPMLPDCPQFDGPSCDGESGNAKPDAACGQGECPSCIASPSLAMVYAPRQCWRNLFDHQSALEHGTLFAELVLPFEGGCRREEMEVRGRK